MLVDQLQSPTMKVLYCSLRINDKSCTLFYGKTFLIKICSYCLVKAEEAARESRSTKQDWYAEMRRKKDEEREAEERKLVSQLNISQNLFLF